MNSSKWLIITMVLFLSSLFGYSQMKTISGSIICQQTSVPLSYAVVQMRALKIGVYSNDSGYFELSVLEENLNDTLEVSCLGYQVQKICARDLMKDKNKIVKLVKTSYEISSVRLKK